MANNGGLFDGDFEPGGLDDILKHFQGLGKSPVEKAADAAEALSSTRRKQYHEMIAVGLKSRNKLYLEERVISQQTEIFTHGDDTLIRAYAAACLYVGNFNAALESFHKLDSITGRECVVLGFIAYAREDYETATQFFGEQTHTIPAVALARAHIHKKEADKGPGVYLTYLGPVISKSAQANTFMGVAYFNKGEFSSAEAYFERAVQLNPESESMQLNLMRAMYAGGRESEVYGQMNKFYTQTGSQLTPKDIQAELGKTQLDLPTITVQPETLFSFVMNS